MDAPRSWGNDSQIPLYRDMHVKVASRHYIVLLSSVMLAIEYVRITTSAAIMIHWPFNVIEGVI